jgi:predicted HTH transcriptional regulator
MLRETIANALVHQDFSIAGVGPMIEIFSNRIEITNPGRSLIERDRIINDKRSRNVKLASAMRSFHLCEERGSGLDKAFQAAEDTGLPAPDVLVSETSIQFTLLSRTAFNETTKGEKLRSLYYHCALRYAARDYMTNASLRERLDSQRPRCKPSVISLQRQRAVGRLFRRPDQGRRGRGIFPIGQA